MIRGTGIDSTVKLYLKGNGADGSTKIFDDSQNHNTITANGNTQISTDYSKFGGSCIYFNNTTSSYLTVDTLDDLMTGKYCIGFFGYVLDSANHTIISKGSGTTQRFDIYFRLGSTIRVIIYNSSNKIITDIIYNISNSTTGFSYYMLYCDGTDLNIYQNGTVCSRTVSTAYPVGTSISTTDLYIGGYAASPTVELMYGYFDEFTIITGGSVDDIDPTIVPTRQRG